MTPKFQNELIRGSLISLCGLNQLITAPTHILKHSSSCIDLILTNQLNLIRDSS